MHFQYEHAEKLESVSLAPGDWRKTITHHPNNSDLLVLPVLCDLLPGLLLRVEPGSMVHLAFEVMQPLDVGPLPAAEHADGRDEDVHDILELCHRAGVRVGAPHANVPLSCALVVLRADDFVAELDEAHELVLVDDALEVFSDLRPGRV